jgi:hypothetical protein
LTLFERVRPRQDPAPGSTAPASPSPTSPSR